MEEDEMEKQRRLAKEHELKPKTTNFLFEKLHQLMQSQGYPKKGSQLEEKLQKNEVLLAWASDRREAERKEAQWKARFHSSVSLDTRYSVPSFRNYDEFCTLVLQSLDGFMIILDTDGIIVFVAENITYLLGYTPSRILGKNLLSLLPDDQKYEVYRKITFTVPYVHLVGKHIDFTCYIKRGDTEVGERPTYEYVKFILSLKDIHSESSSFFGNDSSHLPHDANIWDDQYYLVGTVCVLRADILKELSTLKRISEVTDDSDYNPPAKQIRITDSKGRPSTMETLHGEPSTASLHNDIQIVKAGQYRRPDNIEVIDADSDLSETSLSSQEIEPTSPAVSSLNSFESDPDVDPKNRQEPIDLEFPVDTQYLQNLLDEEDFSDQEKSVAQEDFHDGDKFLDQEEYEAQEDSYDGDKFLNEGECVAQGDVHESDELIGQERPVAPENSLGQEDSSEKDNSVKSMKSLSTEARLDQRASAELENQETMMWPQVQKVFSYIDVADVTTYQPTTLNLLDSSEAECSWVFSKKKDSLKRSLTDYKNAKRFYSSPCASNYDTELNQLCLGSSENQPMAPDQTTEPQPFNHEGEGSEHKEDNSLSFPEEPQELSMNEASPSPSVHFVPVSSPCLSQSPRSIESTISTLKTPEDFMQLWQDSDSQQSDYFITLDSWVNSEQDSSQDSSRDTSV